MFLAYHQRESIHWLIQQINLHTNSSPLVALVLYRVALLVPKNFLNLVAKICRKSRRYNNNSKVGGISIVLLQLVLFSH